jgi:uncharacterized membrane protein
MAQVEKAIEVSVPVSTAYNQWTQFEEFPNFMEGIESVTQLDDARLHWVGNVGGRDKEWYARITEQIPDERIAWTTEGGVYNAGVVTFHRLAPEQTRVMLQMDYDPDGFVESVGDALGFVSRRIEGDLDKFKEFIEGRGVETGAWRGSIGRPVP